MSVSKILVVAGSEFSTAVKSKAFVIGIVMLPIFMGGAIAVEKFSEKHADVSDRKVAIVDRTGALFDVVAEKAARRNAALVDEAGNLTAPRFVPERATPQEGESDADLGLRLSQEIKAGRLFAFVEIPAEALAPHGSPRIAYHSDTPTYRDLAQWLERTMTDAARDRVIKDEGLAPEVVRRLDRRLDVVSLGLVERAAAGGAAKAAEVNPIRTFVVPMVVLFLIFMTVMSAAPQLLNAVLEEKQLRISEFLVSAVTSFELMAGKLLGSVGVAALLGALYMSAGLGIAHYYGMLDQLPFALLPWFFGFLVLATLIYGSIFISIGAACTDMKDAQSMMSPAMLLVMAPMFVWMVVLKEPTGSLATGFTLFPLFTPILMPLRLSISPAPPWWQAPTSFLATLALTAGFVFAAGRIFRVGVLMQGKGASFRDMLRWVRAK
jgi:ABC-2 type transport system permease protein